MAMHLCRLGGTNADLARAFRVSTACIDQWIAKKPEFAEAVHEGRELADARVASALYSRAVGYTHAEEKIFQHEGQVIRAGTLKHYPPDTAACSLWLRNRRPELWREKTQQQIDVANVTPDPLHEAAMRIMAADQERYREIYDDEMRRISEGNPTVMESDSFKREASPLHDRLGIAPPLTEEGSRLLTQKLAKARARPGRIDSPLHRNLGLAEPRTEEAARQFGQMMAQADYELDHGTASPLMEAEIVREPEQQGSAAGTESPAVPETPPEAPQEPAEVSPSPQAPADDFRALLGLPPREE